MSEDALYRRSTQFRLWSFNKTQLAAIRAATNQNAVVRAREAKRRARSEASEESTEEYLTVDEELKLIEYYCSKTMELADFLGVPSNVKVC